ncbi:MAG: aminotransferase class III-fold pyridoxal phosphate-dependent enzyme [Planctomycetota bacterium]|nr:aminotransferase class III-fold pyridoxal phosphate-dependent enzyme [Planctomycetota bacterium]
MKPTEPIQFEGEPRSNDVRAQILKQEPFAIRTFTPSQCVISHSAGSYHYTPEGRKLADFTSGVLVANLGHNPVSWWNRISDYLGLQSLKEGGTYAKCAPLTAYNAITEVEALANQRLIANLRAAPGGSRIEQIMWSASGSEAVQKALWAAMKRTPGKDMIIATRGGFHGKKGLAGAVTGSEQDKERDSRVRFISFPREECDDVESRKQPIDLTRYQQELDELWETCGDQLCCLITEPYLGGGGSLHPQKEYLQALQQFCREHDLIFILDEIQSNFGRTGPMYAFTHYEIEPDVVLLGKGLANGVPASAAVGRRDVFECLDYGEASDTWSANPLTSAAVLATLDEFENTDVLPQGLQLSAVLEAGLIRLKETGLIAKVRGEGCVWGIQCASVGEIPSSQMANDLIRACYEGTENGDAIHLLGTLAGDVIRVSPPLTMCVEECQSYLDVMFNLAQTVMNSTS